MAAVLVGVVVMLGLLFLIARFYQRVPQGRALIRTGMGGPRMSFAGLICLPIAHKIETVDLTHKRLTASFRDHNSLKTRDGIEVETVAAFQVSVSRNAEDILRVAGEQGAEKAAQIEMIEGLFAARFAEAVKAAIAECGFETIDGEREKFRGIVRENIGADLKGYTLHEIALDHFGRKDWSAD